MSTGERGGPVGREGAGCAVFPTRRGGRTPAHAPRIDEPPARGSRFLSDRRRVLSLSRPLSMDASRVGSSARASARPSGPLAACWARVSGPLVPSTRIAAQQSSLRSPRAGILACAASRDALRSRLPSLATRARPGGSLARGDAAVLAGRSTCVRAVSPQLSGELKASLAGLAADGVDGTSGRAAEEASGVRAFGSASGPADADLLVARAAGDASSPASSSDAALAGSSASSGDGAASPASSRRAPSQLVQRALSGAALGAAALAAVLRGGRVFAFCVILASFQASREMASMMSALESAQRAAETALRSAQEEERTSSPRQGVGADEGGAAESSGSAEREGASPRGGVAPSLGAGSGPLASSSSSSPSSSPSSLPSPESSSLTSALVTCGAVLIPTLVALGRSPRAGGLGLTVFGVLAAQLFSEGRPRFGQLASAAFRVLYCGYLPSFWVRLRELGRSGALVLPGPEAALMAQSAAGSAVGGAARGAFGGSGMSSRGWSSSLRSRSLGCRAVLLTVLCVAMADTGAYFVGRALGRTPLSPASPKKTIEGAAGGLSAALAAALLSHALVGWPSTPLRAAAFGALVFACSIIGDLIESSIKRDAGVKDSGTLIPGHGGVLDRLDSYIFTAPCVYWLIVEGFPGL